MLRLFFTFTLIVGLCCGCTKDGSFNIFSIADEISLGQQTVAQISADPYQFPILDPFYYSDVYRYLYEIRNDILNSGEVTYKNEFAWEIKIIDNDQVVNAFCAPGGYIYVYTGLLKFLDSKSALAGVLGHEMAHADKRHSTTQLSKAYGIQTLLDVVLGKNQGLLTVISSELVALQFSRNDEKEADKYSVIYLCSTKYHAHGASDFFEKLDQQGVGNIFSFLSTHPNPGNRVQNIRDEAITLSCGSSISNYENDQSYAAFKRSLR